MDHTIKITDKDGKPYCAPERVKHQHKVRWESDGGYDHFAVVFGPDAPMKQKVFGPGDKVTIEANRPCLDRRSHKYTVIVWSGGEMTYDDPELIVDA